MIDGLNNTLGKEVDIDILESYAKYNGWIYMGHDLQRTLLIFIDDFVNGREIDVIVDFVSEDRVKVKEIIKKYF